MGTIWLVIKFEIIRILRQRSFWILSFVMPAVLLVFQGYAFAQDDEIGNFSQAGESETVAGTAEETLGIGLIDDGGWITETPPGFPPDLLIPYPDDAAARTALEAGEINQYVLIPGDYVKTGEVRIYALNFQMLQGETAGLGPGAEGALQALLDFNLTGDLDLVRTVQNPTPGYLAQHHVINPPAPREGGDQALGILVASLMPYIYYFLLLIGSSYLMRSVVSEKENRTAEVLLLSLEPRALMVGKILGLGVVTFLQLIIWIGGGMLALNQGAQALDVSAFRFPPGFFIWALLFLILGYALYGAVMAAAGAIANNAREGGQVTFLLIIPLMPTLIFGERFLNDPDGGLTMFLSLFPFSAPSAMVTRLAVCPGTALAGPAQPWWVGGHCLCLCDPGGPFLPVWEPVVGCLIQLEAAGQRLAGVGRPDRRMKKQKASSDPPTLAKACLAASILFEPPSSTSPRYPSGV